jgi:hypothetical protein
MKKIITEEEFLPLLEEIKNYGVSIVAGELPDPRYYLCDGILISELLSTGLEKKFPGLDDDDREFLCKALGQYLQSMLVVLPYFVDKEDRDRLVQKTLSPAARNLILDSITRSTNIRNISFSVEEILGEGHEDFVKKIKKIYYLQIRTKSYEKRIENARMVRQLTYDFCMGIINETAI